MLRGSLLLPKFKTTAIAFIYSTEGSFGHGLVDGGGRAQTGGLPDLDSSIPTSPFLVNPSQEKNRLALRLIVSDGVRVRFRVRFQAVKVPIFGGFSVESPTKKANRLKALLRGISLSEYGLDGASSTGEEVVRVRFCCLLS